MNKFKYLKISNIKKIRYLTNYYKKNLYIVFLHGFMSDIDGKKPTTLLKYTIKKKLGFEPFNNSLNELESLVDSN